jgi:hypothetical protein
VRRPGTLQELHHELVRCAPEAIRHHVGRNDLSRWALDVFRDRWLDHGLEAVETAAVQNDSPAGRVRQQLLTLIEERYLL